MTQIEDLILIKELGHGGYGKVYLSKKLNYNIYYATKKIQRAPIDSNSEKLKKFHAEINIMNTLHHENIIRYYGIKKTNNYYYVIMEYANGGDLHDCLEEYIKKYHRPFPEEIVQYLMRQIVEAVAFIHSYNVIHRDLKLENIMVNFDSEKDKQDLNMMRAKIKIIDFGVSKTEAKATTIIGSPNYMDPVILLEYAEYVNKQKIDELRPYSQEVDIWSLGCLCYELFMGKVPFNSKEIPNLINQMNEGTYTLPPNSSAEIRDFLSKMLKRDGKARATARELFFHPFLTNDVRNFGKINIAQQINNNQNGGGILERIEMEKQRRAALNYKGQKSAPIQYTPYNQNQINLNFPPQPQPPNPHAMFQYPGNVPNYQVPGYNNNNNMFQYYQ